jgi:hypothetical protein
MTDRNGNEFQVGDVCVVCSDRDNMSEDWCEELRWAIVEVEEIGQLNCYTYPIIVRYGGVASDGAIGFKGHELEIIGDVR